MNFPKLERRSGLSSVKEAFDNLPSGVCFFNRDGMVVLCNRRMHQLVYEFTGNDLQNDSDLRDLMDGKLAGVRRDKDVFLTQDGGAWLFSRQTAAASDGTVCSQVTAADVTELYRSRKELERENARLEEAGNRLRRLSANIAAVTREEEILTMKMRVHDDIGRSMIAARRLLQQHRPTGELDLSVWKSALRLLQREEDGTEGEDAFSQLQSAAAGIGISIRLKGELPKNAASAYLLVTAMRECATNAVRHAGADELYAEIRRNGRSIEARIRNNGKVPKEAVAEGGGLSSLRARIEKSGGTMTVRSSPAFELTVLLPEKGEETL